MRRNSNGTSRPTAAATSATKRLHEPRTRPAGPFLPGVGLCQAAGPAIECREAVFRVKPMRAFPARVVSTFVLLLCVAITPPVSAQEPAAPQSLALLDRLIGKWQGT